MRMQGELFWVWKGDAGIEKSEMRGKQSRDGAEQEDRTD